jgi:hypothetical protein
LLKRVERDLAAPGAAPPGARLAPAGGA